MRAIWLDSDFPAFRFGRLAIRIMNMDGWFNAKELMAALEKAIEFTAAHGDADPYVQVSTFSTNSGISVHRVRAMVGFEDGQTEFTGFTWDQKEPAHFPYVSA